MSSLALKGECRDVNGNDVESPKRGDERVAAVIIGKNEASTLAACVRSCAEQCGDIVYVDSGSSDESVALATAHGANAVTLGELTPFLPGFARNAGAHRLCEMGSRADFIQFVDGDCVLAEGWVARAVEALERNEHRSLVCGHLREVDASRSVWKRMCEIEWSEPVGEVAWCGGIFVVRRRVLTDVGGFRSDLTAGEEPELCTRLWEAGGAVERLDVPMALHESHMHRFSDWLERELRGGFMDMSVRTPDGSRPFRVEELRMYGWTVGWLALAAALALPGGWLGVAAGLLVVPLQMLRQMLGCWRRGHGATSAAVYGVLVVLLNWPKLAGQLRFLWSRRRQRSVSPLAGAAVSRTGEPSWPARSSHSR